MTAAAPVAAPSAAVAEGRWLLAATALLATWMQGVNISLPNAAAPHIQGALSMSDDELGWIFSSYIAAGAATLPFTRWLAGRFGRKTVLQAALVVFAVGLVLVSRATTPLQFVAARIVQGAAGGPIAPLAMAILLEATAPPRQEAAKLSAAVAAMAGVLSGPSLGGWLADRWDWTVLFTLGLPVAGLIFLVVSVYLPRSQPGRPAPFDAVGASLLVAGLAALQVFLDRGERAEWLASGESRLEAAVAAGALLTFLVHRLGARAPFADRALLRDRNFVVSTVMIFAFGFVLLPTVALTSPMLEELLGYPVDATGYMTLPRSLALVAALVLAWRAPRRIDNRLVIAGGVALVGYANFRMLGYSPQMDGWPVVEAGVLQGAGLGVLLPALTRQAFATLAPALRAEAGEVFNLSRLYGSTLGIATVQILFYGDTQAMHLALTRTLTPQRLAGLSPAGLAGLNEQITGQAAMVALVDQFKLLMLVILAAGPLVLLLRPPRPAAAKPGAAS